MIAAWMLYALAVCGALGLAALAVERALALYRRPVRVAWVAALLGGLSFPLLALLGWPTPDSRSGFGAFADRALPPLLVGPMHAYARVETWAGALDAALVGGWMAASAVILVSLAATLARLRREGAGWNRQDVDGVSVLISPNLGPALIGLRSTSIVVPDWFRTLPLETRRLALRHEQEHLRAGDTRVLVLGLAAAALVPWNPVMWWMLHRLRAAVELDCDNRVLASGADPTAYAGALLDVSERIGPLGRVAPALAESPSQLTRRITAMLTRRRGVRWPVAAAYGAAGVMLLALACEAPPPDRAAADVTGVASPAAPGGVLPEGTPGLEPPQRVSFPPPAYPRLLLEAGVEGTVLLSFVVGTDGRVEPGSIEVLSASNRAFEAPSRDAVARATFHPGRLNGEAVRVLVRMPLRFVIATEPPPGARIVR